MAVFSTCPKCGKQCKSRKLTVRSKKGTLYEYVIYFHKRKNHSIKLVPHREEKNSEGLKKRVNNQLQNAPCPICGIRRRYYTKQIKVRSKRGKDYTYELYFHGSVKHSVRLFPEIDQHSDFEKLKRLGEFIGNIIDSFNIGTKFEIKQLVTLNTGIKGLKYSVTKNRLDELVDLGFLIKGQENNVNYYSIPWSVMGLIYRFVSFTNILYQNEDGKVAGHITEEVIQNKSTVEIGYIPYQILTDIPVKLTDINLEVINSDTGEPLAITILRDEPKEKVLKIKYKEKLKPNQVTKVLIKYTADEVRMNYLFSSGIEVGRYRLCLIHNSDLIVSFYQTSSDRRITTPLREKEDIYDSTQNMIQSCVDIDNPPKFSIIQATWKPSKP